MRLQQLDLHGLRVIRHARLYPEENINLIYGKNGSGKTSILEGIHLLARAKSFRSPKIRDLIRRGEEKIQVAGKLLNSNQSIDSIGIERSNKQTLLKYQQKIIKTASEQAKNLPTLLLTTDSHVLLTGNPRERRKWLDWLLFHVEHEYLSLWKSFQMALRQRNRLLRQRAKDHEFQAWEAQIEKHSHKLTSLCQQNMDKLNQYFSTISEELLLERGEVLYQPGWDVEKDFQSLLRETRLKDRERGYTTIGPQRAELKFSFAGDQASTVLSRGQSKLYLFALVLAQLEFMQERNKQAPILLIDDIAAELDNDARESVSKRLMATNAQSFLTTTEPDVFKQYSKTLFHVEHGEVEKVV